MQVTNRLEDRLLTREQASELLCLSGQTLDDWLTSGEVPSVRTGDGGIRIREGDVLSPAVRSHFARGCELARSPHTVDEAAWHFTQALSLNPHYNLACFELGRMYYTWGRYYEADEPLRQAIELNPCFPAYMNYAWNCNQWGHYGEAEQAFKKALEIVPDHAEARYQLGFSIMITSFFQPERMREAVNQYRSSLELRPEHGLTAWFLGEALVLHLHAFDEARAFACGIEERFPDCAQHVRRLIQLNEPM